MTFRRISKEQFRLIEHIHPYGMAYYALYDINFELLKLMQRHSDLKLETNRVVCIITLPLQ